MVRPLDAVAAYIPAGRYPLPSTLMMTVIPAQVAGVRRVCVACPRPVPEILPERILVFGCLLGAVTFLAGNWIDTHLSLARW